MNTRTALCFGLNYTGTSAELSGCQNDAKDWGEALHMRGFTTRTVLEPKAAEMLDLMRSAIDTARFGDSVVITFSGHGTYVRDVDGDEPDGHDECLCPADCFDGRLITDDELFDVFNDRARGVRLLFISDSCHSGTVARFAPPLAPNPHAPRVRFLPPGNLDLPQSLKPSARGFSPRAAALKSSALLLSGCRDLEYSYDAFIGGRWNGAMTRAALDALRELPERASYSHWHRLIRQKLPTAQYPQVPQLTGTSSQKKWQAL
jgi:hypothetical protein